MSQKPFYDVVVKASDAFQHKLFSCGDIVTDIFMDFDCSLSPDSFGMVHLDHQYNML